MRIARSNYDKPHRCPHWSGSGWRGGPDDDRCASGHIDHEYASPWWQWRVQRCTTCRGLVLPHVLRWTDPTWWAWWLKIQVERTKDEWRMRR